MPLLVKSVVGSFSGTMGADGIIACPRFAKKSRYRFRTSETVIWEKDSTGREIHILCWYEKRLGI